MFTFGSIHKVCVHTAHTAIALMAKKHKGEGLITNFGCTVEPPSVDIIKSKADTSLKQTKSLEP